MTGMGERGSARMSPAVIPCLIGKALVIVLLTVEPAGIFAATQNEGAAQEIPLAAWTDRQPEPLDAPAWFAQMPRTADRVPLRRSPLGH